MGVEIERKFTVKELPKNLESYPYHEIEQAYLNVNPAIRVRREDDNYYMTYKCKDPEAMTNGNIGQTEYNMPLNKASYEHLLAKADGNVITKRRYLIPIDEELKIELDVCGGVFDGRILAEVEFPSEEAARAYKPADWFDRDVTGDIRYSNSHMSTEGIL
jgi:CYTH domain-containing protein